RAAVYGRDGSAGAPAVGELRGSGGGGGVAGGGDADRRAGGGGGVAAVGATAGRCGAVLQRGVADCGGADVRGGGGVGVFGCRFSVVSSELCGASRLRMLVASQRWEV